jgi:peptidoglycan-associated lipoprotein
MAKPSIDANPVPNVIATGPDASAKDDVRLPAAIYFSPDAYKVRPNDMAIVQAHARRLQASPSLHLTLRAYADRQGAPDYNLALSRKRAETVRKLLIAQGARPQQIDIVSAGERRGGVPASRGAASERRVEFVYR